MNQGADPVHNSNFSLAGGCIHNRRQKYILLHSISFNNYFQFLTWSHSNNLRNLRKISNFFSINKKNFISSLYSSLFCGGIHFWIYLICQNNLIVSSIKGITGHGNDGKTDCSKDKIHCRSRKCNDGSFQRMNTIKASFLLGNCRKILLQGISKALFSFHTTISAKR